MQKRTKIIATLSSFNCTHETIQQFYEAGMDVVRINTAHCDIKTAKEMIDVVRGVSETIGILIDTKGPNIRTMALDEPIFLKEGELISIGANGRLKLTYNNLVNEIHDSKTIIIDDGEMELEVVEVNDDLIQCRAVHEGYIYQHKSVNVPNTHMDIPSLTPKDIDFLKFAAENDIDFIAHSFVRNKEDVMAVKYELLKNNAPHISIIAKIENQEGIDNLQEILDVVEGIMVARGDLGIEIPLEKVPLVQKNMIIECRRKAKCVITATQMLQSMIYAPSPTRAEVSDVANAVLDGTDAVMLSGETAQGKYPLKALQMLTRVIKTTEESGTLHYGENLDFNVPNKESVAYLVKSTCETVENHLKVKAIICGVKTGITSAMLSSRRCRVPVYAYCPDMYLVRKFQLFYGIFPSLLRPEYMTTRKLIGHSIRQLLRTNQIQKDDMVALIGFESGIEFSGIFKPEEMTVRR